MAGAPYQDEKAQEVLRRFGVAQTVRGVWESRWEDIAARVLPAYSNSFTNFGISTPGAEKTEEMVDAAAALALPKFAAAMESMLTPRGQIWHRLKPLDRALARRRDVRTYLDDVLEALFRYRYAPNANFAGQQHEIYMGLGAFGTGAMFVDALDRRYGGGLRYKAIHLGEIFFMENHQGIIDTAFRRFPLTARQAVQKYKAENLPDEIVSASQDTVKQDNEFWFVHCIKPRGEDEGYDPGRLDEKGMAFTSVHVAENSKMTVREGGFRSFPFPISRYVQAPGEIYGRSPAFLVLPDIKVLNEQKKTILKQGQRTVDPVLLTHDDGVVSDFDMSPGSINPGGVSAEGRSLVQVLPTGNLAIANDMIRDQRAIINDAFLVTLFQILVETPQMTATEVLERAREKGALLSPTMGRQQSESLGPLINRELDVLEMQGKLPPMPPILAEAGGLEYEVVYDSPLSRAQRAESAAGFTRLLAFSQEYAVATGDPSPLDWFNIDTAMPELADIHAVPARWVSSADQVAVKRQRRSQAQAMDKMIEAAPAAAGVMKAVPNAAAGR